MRSKSFTLIELLVVIAIMAMLAGLLLPAVLNAMSESQKAAVKMVIRNTDLACREYKNDWGVYPRENDVDGWTMHLYDEVAEYLGVLPGGGKGPYLKELDSSYIRPDVYDATNLYMCDYWRHAIVYDVHQPEGADILTVDHNTASFDLVSYGPDGKPGEADVDDDGDTTEDKDYDQVPYDSPAGNVPIEAGWLNSDDIGNWE